MGDRGDGRVRLPLVVGGDVNDFHFLWLKQ